MLNQLLAGNKSMSIDIDLHTNGTDELGSPKVTVLVGPNGSRKSLALRLICEATLGKHRYRLPGGTMINIHSSWTGQRPKKLICISGTPLDRFPRPRAIQPLLRKMAGDVGYVCFGPRGAKGGSGVKNNERSLVWTLLRTRTPSKTNEFGLEAAFANVGLLPKVYVYLAPTAKFGELLSFAHRPRDSITLSEVTEALHVALTNTQDVIVDADFVGDVRYLEGHWAASQVEEVAEEILKLIKPSARAQILIDGGRVMRRRGTLSLILWKSLMTLGVLDVAKTEFASVQANARRVSSDELSSGQWGWLSSFCGIFAELENQSLILIDEPENSLHPQWQRHYMPSLLEGLRGCKGCQVVLATHSPFIAAGLPPAVGKVVQLKTGRGEDRMEVRSELVGNLFGWRASDIYDRAFDIESTRDDSFMNSANEALAAIRDGRKLGLQRLIELKSLLNMDQEQLPGDDPMREILSQISLELDELRDR